MGFVYLAVFVRLDVNLCGWQKWLCMHIQNENYNGFSVYNTLPVLTILIAWPVRAGEREAYRKRGRLEI